MAQRSPYNDRYKVEQKSKARKSASAAKPKRAVSDLSSDGSAKKPAKKTSAWSRAKAASASSSSRSSSGSSSKAVMRAVESSPRMKQLRRIWWWLWGGALAMAVGLWLLQDTAQTAGVAAQAVARAASNATTETIDAAFKQGTAPYGIFLAAGWGLWIAAMGGAFYLEFVPIRKERASALAASKAGGKGTAAKSEGSSKAKKSDNAAAAANAKVASKGKAKATKAAPVTDEPPVEDASDPEDAE